MRLKGFGRSRAENRRQSGDDMAMTEALSYAHGAAHVPETAAVPDAGRRVVGAWLLACCALVAVMVLVGGVTRLTHSGLSIVEWQPLVGTIPPLGENDWQVVFEKYKQTPEYKLVNLGMSLAEFKGIFWWEYFHRLLGRLIGLVFFVPLAWFWVRGRLDRALA
jgi:cytochrome c oxidase assembly protein subunit 15